MLYEVITHLLISRDSSRTLADDERMNIVCALVGKHRLQVAHVAKDGVLVGDAVGPQNISCRAGDIERIV